MVGMEWVILAASLIAAVIIIFIAYKLLKFTVKFAVAIILNALGGLFILLLANFVLNMGIPYDIPTLLICILCGVPGAICVIILMLAGIIL
jgi:hypothetical protein